MFRRLFLCVGFWLCALPLAGAEPAPQHELRQVSIEAKLFWHDHRRGWHFYEDPEPPLPPRQEPPPQDPPRTAERTPAPKAKTSPARAPELVEFERIQKDLEEFRKIAIVNPTPANVRRYMQHEARVVRQASFFADLAQRVAWTHPDLDMTLEGRPVNAQAIPIYDQQLTLQRTRSIAALAKTHVIFFFYRSDCPYCHAFAPTLAAFEARHGLQVIPISLDGGSLPGFPEYRLDNGISRALQVRQVPAVFLAEPRSQTITPIGFGVLSEAELAQRIATVGQQGFDDLQRSPFATTRLD